MYLPRYFLENAIAILYLIILSLFVRLFPGLQLIACHYFISVSLHLKKALIRPINLAKPYTHIIGQVQRPDRRKAPNTAYVSGQPTHLFHHCQSATFR